MSKYINYEQIRNTFVETIDSLLKKSELGKDEEHMIRASLTMLHIAMDAQSVDIVRCKDCIYHHHDENGNWWCVRILGGFLTKEDGFCLFGKSDKEDTEPSWAEEFLRAKEVEQWMN